MLAWSFSARTAEEVAALLRALGRHRYVREVDHALHWLVDAALSDLQPFKDHAEAFQARRAREPALDPASRDPSLHRPASVDEISAALAALWSPEPEAVARRAALLALAAAEGLELPSHPPFEGDPEFPDHPSLVLLSWTLFPVVELDAERHAGALREMAEARAEVDPEAPVEHEAAELGLTELAFGAPRGVLVGELLVWADGPYAYSDYVFRGASKLAKLPDPPVGLHDLDDLS